jgi:dCTP deaminase
MPPAGDGVIVIQLLENQRHVVKLLKKSERWLEIHTEIRLVLNHSKMILSDKRILEEMEKGSIKISPYDRNCLGSNSYDVHLGKCLATYTNHILDAKQHNQIEYFDIPDDGFVLYPHVFYLGVTLEYTETHEHVPFLEGKSSTGRLGIDIHATAGKGDVGFCGNWTLEISVKQPVKIYHGMPIGQLIYFPVDGEIDIKYNQKANAKYSGQPNRPIESMMWKNKF